MASVEDIYFDIVLMVTQKVKRNDNILVIIIYYDFLLSNTVQLYMYFMPSEAPKRT